MPITFPIFTPPPDLSRPLQRRYTTAQDMLRLSGATALVTWPANRAETAFVYTYSIKERANVQAAKMFFADRGGQHEPFLLPTWQRDFALTLPATEADAIITVAVDDYAGQYLTTTADDELGRFVFCYDQAQGLHIARVITATGDGPGASAVELENPLPWTPSLGAIWGFVALVRMSEDQQAFQHMTPEHMTFELSTITVRQRSTTNETLVLDGSIGPEATEPFTTATFEAIDSPKLRFDYAHADGPVNLHFPQDETFATRWCLWLGSERVRMAKSADGTIWPPADGLGFPSDLFPDGKPNTTALALAFDQNSWEVVAWENTAAGTITVRRRFDGVIVEHTFPGRSPALFNDGIIAVTARLAGLSDVVCYYDKPGHNCVFARIQRDNFGIEYAVVLGPARIRQMLEAGAEGTKGVIRFIDDSYRVVTLRTEDQPVVIVPPSPYLTGLFDEAAGLTTLVTGDYFASIVFAPDSTEQTSASAAVLGDLLDEIVGLETLDMASAAVLIAGDLQNNTRATEGTERLTLAARLSGVYALIIRTAQNSEDNAVLNYRLSAVYA